MPLYATVHTTPRPRLPHCLPLRAGAHRARRGSSLPFATAAARHFFRSPRACRRAARRRRSAALFTARSVARATCRACVRAALPACLMPLPPFAALPGAPLRTPAPQARRVLFHAATVSAGSACTPYATPRLPDGRDTVDRRRLFFCPFPQNVGYNLTHLIWLLVPSAVLATAAPLQHAFCYCSFTPLPLFPVDCYCLFVACQIPACRCVVC